MDSLPSPTQVAKNHLSIYEALYQQVDPAGTGKVGAIEAATFLKKSGLPDDVLMRIWDMSDPGNTGYLTKSGFFTSLKLIALAQSGQEVSMARIFYHSPPPQMHGTGLDPPAPIDWSIKASEKIKYEEMFAALGPINDRLPGAKVKPVMLNSKLPVETLGKIWDLSDIDQDGFLDREEFMLAMHLIYKALENIPVPSELPPDLLPSTKRQGVLPDLLDGPRRASTPSLDSSSLAYKNALNTIPWVVSGAEKAEFDTVFHTLDADRDGFVTGTDIKSIFLKSGLPPQTLAHIWNLCNVRDNGKLNSEQFALAMYLVNQKVQGNEPPAALSPHMVPPTLRPKPSAPSGPSPPPEVNLLTGGEELCSPPTPAVVPPLTSGNKELDLIAAEFNQLQKERQTLEADISKKEEELKAGMAEVASLTQEQDTLTAMLKQLDLQRGEARKRLDNLDSQKLNIENNIKELTEKYEEEKAQIEILRDQVEEQQQNIAEQEKELGTRQQELAQLQEEESRLEQEISQGRAQVDNCTRTLQDTQLQINKSKLKISQLQEQKRQMDSAMDHFSQALEIEDPSVVPDSMLSTPLPIDPEASRLGFESPEKPVVPATAAILESDDPFKSKDPFAGINGFSTDPFEGEDPFKSEGTAAFARPDNPTSASDPFAGSDPFADTFGSSAASKADDPFKGKDPFGLSPSSAKADPFAATFGDKSPGADPFGTDPFLAPHHPPPRPESPTPQLPPKKGKAPPPRPAPPKHGAKATPSRAAPAPPPPPVNYTPSTFPDPFAATPDPFAVSPAGGPTPSAVTDPFDPFGVASAPPAPPTNDPFAMGGSDPFASSTTDDGFANFANFDQFEEKSGTNGWPGATEEEQLAWVTSESLRLEEERRRRQEAAEQADLELAIRLSQTSM